MVVYCLGDSLTEGDHGIFGKSGIGNIQPENYPYFLERLSGWSVKNCGHCGYRTTDYLRYYQSGAVNLAGADRIIIMLGTNGGLDLNQDTPENDAYRELIHLCRKDAPVARIFLCTPPHATENPAMSNFGYAPQVKKAVAFTRYLAEEESLFLIDLAACDAFTAETESVMQPNDGLHFSAEGYLAIAKYIYAHIS